METTDGPRFRRGCGNRELTQKVNLPVPQIRVHRRSSVVSILFSGSNCRFQIESPGGFALCHRGKLQTAGMARQSWKDGGK